MQKFTLSGYFYFDSQNIQSMEGFHTVLRIDGHDINRAQHLFIKEKLQEKLGLQAQSVPNPTSGDPNSHLFSELNFETRVPALCKHLIGILKQGKVEELKANGRRYPPDSDHPLFSKLGAPENLKPAMVDFNAMNAAIEQTLEEATRPAAVPSVKESTRFNT